MARRGKGRIAVGALGTLALLAALRGRDPAVAAEGEAALPLPRFASLHSDRVFLRSGPGARYPIEWVLTRKGMPVEIIAQFEHWRRVRDWEGTTGWVHERLLTGKREVIVSGGIRPLYRYPDPTSALVARAESGVVARLLECRGGWCRIEAAGIAGWVPRAAIWGVFPDETVP